MKIIIFLNNILIDTIPSFWSSEYWKGILQNGLGCTLGSFIGVGVTLLIYYKSITRDAKEKQKIKIEDQTKKLFIFSSLVKNVIPLVKQQRGHLKDFIEKIRENSIDLPLMTFVPLNDLKRIIDNISFEETGLAYIDKFGNDPETAKEFSNILGSVDYLHLEFDLIPGQMIRAQNFDYERKTKVQNIFAKSFEILGSYMLQQDLNNPNEIVTEIQNVSFKFQEKHTDNYDIKFYNDNFFIPMNDLMVKFLSAGYRLPQFISVAQLTRDGKQFFGNIQSANLLLAESIENILTTVDEGIADLLKYSSKKRGV